MMNSVVYRGRIINPISPSQFEEWVDGGLVVDENGVIVDCGRFSTLKTSAVKIIHFKDKVIIPGLVDCHIHLPQLDQRGKHGATLLEWLEKYIFPSEFAFKDLKVVDDVAKRFFKKLILNGTTTSSIYVTIHKEATDRAFEIASATGLRIIMGKVMMDGGAPSTLVESTKKSIDDSVWLYEKWHNSAGGRLKYAFTPRFALTCSEDIWRQLGGIMRVSDAYLQTHLSETVEEIERVRELFPGYCDYTDLFEKNGCLTPKTLLAHAIYVSASECSRIAGKGAKVVHCPTSNLFLKSGRMPVELIEEAGITYGLGTDVGAGTSMSLFSAMRYADFVQPKISVPPEKAFYLATMGGASVLSMEDSIGNFRKGKRADFCVIDIKGIDPRYELSALSAAEVLSLLMYRGNGNVVNRVYLDGRELDVDMDALKSSKQTSSGGGRQTVR